MQINRERHYPRRAIDFQGQILCQLRDQSGATKLTALAFMNTALMHQIFRETVTAAGLPSYGAANYQLGYCEVVR